MSNDEKHAGTKDLDDAFDKVASMFFRLEGRQPVRCKTMAELSGWHEACNENPGLKRVGLDVVKGIEISTVFIGMDPGHGRDEMAQMFESMVIIPDSPGRDRTEKFFRYTTWEQAEKGHGHLMKLAKHSML